MNRNIFKYLRKKILNHSTVSEEQDESTRYYKIESLGYVMKVSFPIEFPSKKIATGLLIDRLVEIPEYLNKLEKVENRNQNLKDLLE